jgi:hypothetical protein
MGPAQEKGLGRAWAGSAGATAAVAVFGRFLVFAANATAVAKLTERRFRASPRKSVRSDGLEIVGAEADPDSKAEELRDRVGDR